MGPALRCCLLALWFVSAWGAQSRVGASSASAFDDGHTLRKNAKELLQQFLLPQSRGGRLVQVEISLPIKLQQQSPQYSNPYVRAAVEACVGARSASRWKLDDTEPLGRGEIGVVVLAAEEGRPGERVALKVQWVRDPPGHFATQVAAQSIAAGLGLAPAVHDSWVCGESASGLFSSYFGITVMRRVQGETLADSLKAKPKPESDTDVYCQPLPHMGRLDSQPNPSPRGYISQAVHASLNDALRMLDNYGLITKDVDETGILVEDGQVLFVGFGIPRGKAHIDGQASRKVLGETLRCWTHAPWGYWPPNLNGTWPTSTLLRQPHWPYEKWCPRSSTGSNPSGKGAMKKLLSDPFAGKHPAPFSFTWNNLKAGASDGKSSFLGKRSKSVTLDLSGPLDIVPSRKRGASDGESSSPGGKWVLKPDAPERSGPRKSGAGDKSIGNALPMLFGGKLPLLKTGSGDKPIGNALRMLFREQFPLLKTGAGEKPIGNALPMLFGGKLPLPKTDFRGPFLDSDNTGQNGPSYRFPPIEAPSNEPEDESSVDTGVKDVKDSFDEVE